MNTAFVVGKEYAHADYDGYFVFVETALGHHRFLHYAKVDGLADCAMVGFSSYPEMRPWIRMNKVSSM